jgi:hypothetical protein
MKNISRLTGIVLMFLLGFVMIAKSAGVTDLVDYCTGPNQKTCPFKVDANGNITSTGSPGTSTVSSFGGNVSIVGNVTTNGTTVFTPSSVTTVSTSTTLSPTVSTYVQLLSTGTGPVNLQAGSNGSFCAISTTTATNGQMLVLASTTTVNYVTISTGTTACVFGNQKVLTTDFLDITLFFDQPAGVWTTGN